MFRERETEKGQVKVQDVATPDANRIEYEERLVGNTVQRFHPLNHVQGNSFDFLVERKYAQQSAKYPHDSYHAEERYIKPGRGKQMQE